MAVPLEQFIKQLEDSGIIACDTLKDFIPPKSDPKDAEELMGELVRKKKLTKFQAEEVAKGNGKSLVLGNYVLLERIGAGGMGQVFKARHRRMDRLVAVKLLPPATSKDKAAIARFEREVKAAAKINHPNIVAAHDADCANGIHFLVMELVDGRDLSALVKKNGPFSIEKTVNYILQAAKGLEAAHKKGIVHRDIKPSNLLLDVEGNVKVLDMGLARLSWDEEESPQGELTSSGMVMGTVDFMAPEQALDTKHADARADIYSLGCSLYYMLVGKPMYQGDTMMKRLVAHREHPTPSLKATKPDVPDQLDLIFKKLVAKKVEDRYQTMTQVVEALGKFHSSCTEQPSIEEFETTVIDVASRNGTIVLDPPNTRGISGSGGGKLISKRAIGAAFFGFMILAAIISLVTRDGTLVVEVSQKDTMVKVLDLEGKVEVSKKGEKEKVEISVDPGKHRLKVEKDGFEVFAKEFEIKWWGKETIIATLIPLEVKPIKSTGKIPLAFEMPGFGQWVKGVQAMPAEKQLEAVSKKLMELNPGFDGKLTGLDEEHVPVIVDGKVRTLGFCTDHVSDISPVRSLDNLRHLVCGGSPNEFPPRGRLSDLSPLMGMNLLTLGCDWSPNLADLSPLKGMPLVDLRCAVTSVADLSPLSGSQLNWLSCFNTNVSDLTPIKHLPLHTLHISGSKIIDLSPLVDMALDYLYCDGTKVTDLTPLKRMSLKRFSFSPETVTDGIDVLRKMSSLKTIHVYGNDYLPDEFWKKYDSGEFSKRMVRLPLAFEKPGFDQWVKDVRAMTAEKQLEAVSKKLMELNPGFDGKLTGLNEEPGPVIVDGRVRTLGFCTDHVSDISPVRSLDNLRHLICGGSRDVFPPRGRLSDLSPLTGMNLLTLGCDWSANLEDLSPLKGMPLVDLRCDFTAVADLSPLLGSQLNWLSCSATNVSDLTPLKLLPLHTLQFATSQVTDLAPLNGIPLRFLNIIKTQVTDLSPLKGMPLEQLYMNSTLVTDLSPVKGMPIKVLGMAYTHIRDLTPIKDIPLQQLDLDFKMSLDTDFIRSIKTLKTINDKPAVEFCKEVDAYYAASKKPLAFQTPGFDQWVKEVTALPVGGQLNEVSKRLQELNAGFDGKMTPTIEDGVVTGLQFSADDVVDISPLRAFMGLKILDCSCNQSERTEVRGLNNLAALKGMSLAEINFGHARVADLSPLKGMKLTKLNFYGADVSDLSPLIDMPLTEIDIGANPVTDLTPLKGMPLSAFAMDFTLVTNLSPLTGMKLTYFCRLRGKSDDLSPLKDMPLHRILLDFKPERDTEFLRSIKTLEFINEKPAAEFWKEVEGKKQS